jgi:hypothetical protein
MGGVRADCTSGWLNLIESGYEVLQGQRKRALCGSHVKKTVSKAACRNAAGPVERRIIVLL